jgi:hypothetical protein
MSGSIHIYGEYSKDNDEYRKHYEIASVCLKHGATIPQETDLYFAKDGTLLSEYTKEYAEKIIQSGPIIKIEYTGDVMYDEKCEISIKDLPTGLDKIVIEYSY